MKVLESLLVNLNPLLKAVESNKRVLSGGNAIIRFISKSDTWAIVKNGLEGGKEVQGTSSNTGVWGNVIGWILEEQVIRGFTQGRMKEIEVF